LRGVLETGSSAGAFQAAAAGRVRPLSMFQRSVQPRTVGPLTLRRLIGRPFARLPAENRALLHQASARPQPTNDNDGMAFLTSSFDPWVVFSCLALAGAACCAALVLARRVGTLRRSLRRAEQKMKEADAGLRRRADADPLTGLPERAMFEDRLLHALLRRQRQHERKAARLAVLFVDLDGFKPVNDEYTHAVGDQVIRETARRLQATAREGDTIARIGADEFLVLMEDVADQAEAAALAARLLKAVARPLPCGDRQVSITASIGIVVHPDQGDKGKLIAHANAAMDTAKRAGGNTVAMFEARVDAQAREQSALQADLRRAVELRQLQLYYQPKVDGTSGHIHGVEALLRWNHPERGQVSPAVFIPMAERFNLINALGNWVIEEACRQMRAWADSGLRMRVAINLSVHQLREDDLVPRIDDALRRHHLEPSQLLCEITESVAMEDIASTQRTFEGLRRIGVFLSIDDFGTGYSSLSYLTELPAAQLKIDRRFISGLNTSKNANAIVSAVIRLAHELGLRVVAEGVETLAQRDILVSLGCDELQGFYLARPMPAEALEAWTEGRKPEGAADFAPSVIGSAADLL